MTELQDGCIEVARRSCGLHAGIGAKRGLHRAMPQMTPDTLILAWVLIEKELGSEMSKEMHMHLKTSLSLDVILDLDAECMFAL